MSRSPSLRRLASWGVHMFTASGAFVGFLALLAIEDGDFPRAFLWLALSLVIDTVDGTLARWVRVSEFTPRFEGFLVDYIVDYFTYVILPALLLYRAGMLPDGWQLLGVALILVSTTYHYGNVDLKAPDYFFFGFPGWWNLVVFYLYALSTGPWVNLVVVLFFVVATPVRLKYIHPFRVEELRWLNALAAVVLTVCGGIILWQLPERHPLPIAVSMVALAYLGGLGVLRTFVPRNPAGGSGEVGA